ncbi:phosphatidylserine decarboxylase [Leptolyngbya sp. 7M]|uniref:phosphatidylserine decarboxylase n=1 Tax=Leptolyngbya sp. 7M TaxID=2812896 RepID=UPI001B8C9DFA|nr:phosphatidylserine decarboxylase [Leptolyngbya sp. 7M]QYO65923.1 phosphatidylserine decarboxylase [Leptolyngbya sp. 7M]
MAKEGLPFVLVPAVIALLLAYFGLWAIALILAAVAAFMAYFFRDPERVVPDSPGIVVSAADGRITRIEADERGTTVSVFLSPLDVHINRSPIAGKITKQEYIPGRKAPATNDSASLSNERNSLTIAGGEGTVVCTQIAGILARRIVCWSKEGDEVKRGQRFGLIKFSSRTDLLIPAGADVLVEVGDRVRGGETIIARFNTRATDNVSATSP